MKKPSKTLPLGGPTLGIRRLETLTDGVFAIVMTILVFDLKVPVIAPGAPPGELERQLLNLWPHFFSFILSVIVLGVHWVGYTAAFHFIHRSNRIHHWITILYLLCLACVPFSAGLLGEFPYERAAIILYCLNLIAAGAALYLHLWYVVTHKLIDPDTPPPVIRMGYSRALWGVAAYIAAIPLSFVSPKLCLVLFVLGPLTYILPGRADRHFKVR